MIQAIEKRISIFSQVPAENGELIQVLRYERNQFYKPHHDYFSDTFNLKRGGQRIATMLMYLSDDVEGGETYFPMAGSGDCSCGGRTVKGLSVKPIQGDAVLFWSMGLDGQSDPSSLHGGCEVLAGEKWSATKWMRQRTTSWYIIYPFASFYDVIHVVQKIQDLATLLILYLQILSMINCSYGLITDKYIYIDIIIFFSFTS